MKRCRALFVFLALALSLVAAEKADITLSSGQVLKAARIATIGPKEVSIMHAGGLIGVAPEDVPLDVLARAHMDFETAGNDITLRSTGGAMQSWIEKDLRPYLKKLKEVR